MDKIHLNEQQIKQLVDFIRSKRFFDPPVVVEILDHLACKVEEIITAHPATDFNEAVQQAYKSFGVMGFRPVQDAYQRIVQKKYRKIYWRKMRTSLTDLKILPLILFAGWLVYKIWMWSALKNITGVLGENLFYDFFLVTYTISALANYLPFRKEEFFKSALSAHHFSGSSWYMYWFWIFSPHSEHAAGTILYMGAAFNIIMTTFAILCFFAERHTRSIAYREYQQVRSYLHDIKKAVI